MDILKRTIRTRTRGQIRKYFIVFIIITGILGSAVSLRTIQKSGTAVSSQNQNKLLVMARSGASTIELFLNSLGTELSYINRIKEVSDLQAKETRIMLHEFISNTPNSPLFAVDRIDRDGKFIVVENRAGIRSVEGTSAVARDYFKWAKDPKNRGKIYFGAPFVSDRGVMRGKHIVIVAVPSYSGNKFMGELIGVVDIEKGTNMLIDPLKIHDETHIYITDTKGNLVLGDEKLEGQNLLEYARKKQWQGWKEFTANFNKVLNQDEGRLEWNFVSGDGKFEWRDEVAFKTMKIGDQVGKVIISNPQNLIQASISPIVSSQKWGIVILVFGFTLGGILFVVIDQISHKEGYLKGYKDALDELMGKKKKS